LGYLGHQQASAQSLWPLPGHQASEPRRPHGAHAGLQRSRDKDSFADKLLSAMRNEFGGHEITKE
jgi:6-phosphogluconate dehydrogenase (decarboxylating)